MRYPKHVRELQEQFGGELGKTGHHYLLIIKKGERSERFIIPGSCSDFRGLRNLKSLIRRKLAE